MTHEHMFSLLFSGFLADGPQFNHKLPYKLLLPNNENVLFNRFPNCINKLVSLREKKLRDSY